MNNVSSIVLTPKAEAFAASASESAQLTAAWQARNGDGVTSHFAENAMAMVPEITASGLPAIKAYVARALGDPGFSVNMETDMIDASASGDLGYAHGRFRLIFIHPVEGKPHALSGQCPDFQASGGWSLEDRGGISTVNSFDN